MVGTKSVRCEVHPVTSTRSLQTPMVEWAACFDCVAPLLVLADLSVFHSEYR